MTTELKKSNNRKLSVKEIRILNHNSKERRGMLSYAEGKKKQNANETKKINHRAEKYNSTCKLSKEYHHHYIVIIIINIRDHQR